MRRGIIEYVYLVRCETCSHFLQVETPHGVVHEHNRLTQARAVLSERGWEDSVDYGWRCPACVRRGLTETYRP
jgi:hypothetical protein